MKKICRQFGNILFLSFSTDWALREVKSKAGSEVKMYLLTRIQDGLLELITPCFAFDRRTLFVVQGLQKWE